MSSTQPLRCIVCELMRRPTELLDSSESVFSSLSLCSVAVVFLFPKTPFWLVLFVFFNLKFYFLAFRPEKKEEKKKFIFFQKGVCLSIGHACMRCVYNAL